MEDVKEDISAERNEQPMSLKSKIVLSLCLFILLGFFAAIIVSAVKAPPDMLVEVDRGKNYVIVYDRDTGVMYCMTNGKYNIGERFPLYNSDGSLRLYEEAEATTSEDI